MPPEKNHYPLPFIDQMIEKLSGHEYYCFLDGYFGYNQIPVAPKDQEALMVHLHIGECLLVYVMHLLHSKDA